MAENEKELKSLLVKVKEESEKAGLKLDIQKPKIMASSSITSWQQVEKQWKQWQNLFSCTPKSLQTVTAALKLKDACSLEEELWQCIKKWRLCQQKSIAKAMVFPVVMYRYVSWIIRKAEHWRIDAFELWC